MFMAHSMVRAHKKFVSAILAVTTVSCGPSESHIPRPPSAEVKRIIGDNDLRPVSQTELASHHLASIGRMELGCTVTHVGFGIAITAGHCVSHHPFAGIQESIPCQKDAHKITWGVTIDSPKGYDQSRCYKIIATEYNSQRDYAIIALDHAPKAAMPVFIPNEDTVTALGIGTGIQIYSHPKKRPLEWSGWCEIASTFETPLEAPLEAPLEHQFGYGCDTEGGSSGAAVLNERFEVVGIHNYYDGTQDLNGATYLSSTPLAKILEKLASENATPSPLTPPTPP